MPAAPRSTRPLALLAAFMVLATLAPTGAAAGDTAAALPDTFRFAALADLQRLFEQAQDEEDTASHELARKGNDAVCPGNRVNELSEPDQLESRAKRNLIAISLR